MDEPRFVELADGIHAMLCPDRMSNCTIVVTSEGVLVVDAPYARRLADAVVAQARRLTALPIRWVVSSHYHGDHTLNLGVFAPPAQVIGHARNRAVLADRGEQQRAHFSQQFPALAAEYAVMPLVLPNLTYTDALTLYLGNREVRLWHPGPAHTDGDTVLLLPAERLAVTADVLSTGQVPVARDADLAGWIAALDQLAALDLDTIVPGHGPISTRADLAKLRGLFQAVVDAIRPYAEHGVPLERALAEIDLGPYTAWPRAERLAWALERAYHNLRPQP